MAKKEDNKDIKNYLQSSEELYEEANEDIEHVVAEGSGSGSSTGKKKSGFWKSWSRNKKIGFVSGTVFLLLALSLALLFLVIRPSKTKNYIGNSWHGVVNNSSDIDRSVKSEVNLDGTRNLADSLYTYNKALGSVSYDSKSKSSIFYESSKLDSYAELIDNMSAYFSESANLLSKSDSSETVEVSDSDISSLNEKGDKLKKEVEDFEDGNKLSERLSPEIFNVDEYLNQIKLKKEEIAKEKQAEEEAQKQAEEESAAQKAQAKEDIDNLVNNYYTAFINANQEGVKATLTEGFSSEYDFSGFSPEARAAFKPKSYRIISIEEDGENYKVNSSVVYVYIYQDSDSSSKEQSSSSAESWRVVRDQSAGAWKIDGSILN